jgi:hypothetical protein
MKKREQGFFKIFLFSILFSCIGCASLVDDLAGKGVRLEVHGAPQDQGHWVGTLRDPHDFFKFEFVSLLSKDSDIRKQLSSVKRHDVVRVWGEIIVKAPQKHINVTKLVIEENSETSYGEAYDRHSVFPKNFPNERTPFRALVHAINQENKLLVVEYQDVVLPVRLAPGVQLPELYRNDVVEMTAKLASTPEYPKHLRALSLKKKVAIVDIHGKDIERTGVLVKFPKSSQVIFDVFAVKEDIADGLSRQYTIVNFEDQELFKKIREKLSSFWDAGDASKITNGRNKLINPTVVVKIKGKGNVVDPQQANPQILVDHLDDVELVERVN